MAHSSNRDRIARAAEEARLTALEKKTKLEKTTSKTAKKPTAAKRSAAPVRMKIVWEACSAAGAVLGTFAYPDKLAAEAKVALLTRSTGRTHVLRETKVPMV
jgi:hypothetical protein